MKNLAILFLLVFFSFTAFAQKPKTKSVKKTALAASAKTVGDEKTEFEKAFGQTNATERIAALQRFVKIFPKSSEKTRALELIVSARAEIADEKLRLSETASGVDLFKLAVREAPKPISDKLFTEIVLQIPTNLFLRGERAAALQVAKIIEKKAEGNSKQILGLATFYLGMENASEAKRLAEKAIAIEPDSPAAYQTLGVANRLNFQLDEATANYAKALELDKNSIVSKRSLAEMKRATGKTDEAVALYREILTVNSADFAAQTGLILSLFDAENVAEAETEMQKSLEQTPNNLLLLVGAAYSYAARNNGTKAIEFAQKAIAIEPRYTWAYIALARGLAQQKRPLEAERALLVARQYGNFPTLDYEIASARLQAGFFREAADELKKSFVVKNDTIETRLGGRVLVEAKNFIDLLALERRASIFEPTAADNLETAQKLKSLLDFSQKLETLETNETAISETANEFVNGDDKMKLHRQLFVASRLLEKKTALPKVLELTKAAVASVDSSLDVASPAAAVLADELYESRRLAINRGELVIVPNIPRQTLSGILRGRIEEISGWALFQEDKPSEAAVRLKRAVSVLPEKSAWWRSSLWRLGVALDADGKSKEALDAYIKSYTNDAPNSVRLSIIESLYQKVNGNLDGLEQKIGAKSVVANADLNRQAEPSETVSQNAEKENPTVAATPTPEAKTQTIAETLPAVKETPQPIMETPQPTPEATPTPEIPANKNTETSPKKDITPEIKENQTPETPVVVITEALTKQTETKKNQKPITKPETNPEKPLFESVIITVPKTETAKDSIDEKTSEEDSGLKKTSERFTNGRKGEAEPSAEEKPPQCKITISEENVSLLNASGSLSVLINIEGEGNLEEVKAASSSPNDVEVTLEPVVDAVSKHTFFVIKSISPNKGEYTVTFESPCGKKEVTVKVR